MKTLPYAPNPTLYLSTSFPPRKPINLPPLNPTTQKLTLLKPHASNAKGFSSTRPSSIVANDQNATTKKPNNNDDKNKNNARNDDEFPQEVFNRVIVRVLVSVLVPMGLGLGFLYVFGELKERQIWGDMPMWVPFTTTLLTFGASTLGIAYGALSTSLDAEREGTFLGIQEVQRNWVEMWQQEEDQS